MRKIWATGAALVFVVAIGIAFWPARGGALRVGMSPYQDLAMIVNIGPLGLEKKYGTNVDLVTMGWEEIIPSVASAGRGLDLGFASYAEYLAKYHNLNPNGSDPVDFIAPLYVFKGGAFVTFDRAVPKLTPATVGDSAVVRQFLDKRIGAQKGSLYEIMLFRLAEMNGVKPGSIKLVDTPMDQGYIAAEQGSLDLASAGLTQLTEVERRGGRAVLTMDDLKFADFTGFVVKRSVLERRRADIANLVNMWFDSVNYVYTNIDQDSKDSLKYLDAKASVRYTLSEYKKALSQEFLPQSMDEAKREFGDSGKYPFKPIGETISRFLLRSGTVKTSPPINNLNYP